MREVRFHATLKHSNIVGLNSTWQGTLLPDELETILKLVKKLGNSSSGSCTALDSPSDLENQEQEKNTKEYQFIVMELCEGGTLMKDKINSNSISKPAEPLQILQQICSALAYIHDKGLIHRDLKPDNIFIQEDTIKIADFGLVTKKGKHSTNRVGTELYMAPEVTAEKGDYDNKVDIYSLGLIFLELLVPLGTKDLLWEVKVCGDKVPFKNSSFLQFMAEWLKDKINSKSKWTTEAEKIMEELKKIPW